MFIGGGGEVLIFLVWLFISVWPLWLIVGLVAYAVVRRRRAQRAEDEAKPETVPDTYRASISAAMRRELATLRFSNGDKKVTEGFARAVEFVEAFDSAAQPVIEAKPATALRAAGPSVAESAPPAKTDNTLALLYLGGFLFVAAVALFVLLADVSGTLKTILVALAAALLYGGGFWLHTLSDKLRPAAVTFVAIGIGSLPFLGLALTEYSAIDGDATWWSMSLLGIAGAGYAVYALRSHMADYLLSFAWLSFAVSSLALAEASLAVMLWGAIVAAIVIQAGLYHRGVKVSEGSPYVVSAQFAVPLTILATIFSTPIVTAELWQIAVTLGLAAAFYVQQAVYRSEPERSALATAGHVIGLVAAGLFTYDVTEAGLETVGAILAVIALLQLAVVWSRWFTALKCNDYSRALYGLTGALPLVATLFWYEDKALIVTGLLLAVVVGAALLWRRREVFAAVPIIIAALSLPPALGWYDMDKAVIPLGMAAMYAAVALSFWYVRFLQAGGIAFIAAWRFGYVSALVAGFFWVLGAGSAGEVAVASAALAAAAAALSYFERSPYVLAVTPLMLALALERWLSLGTTFDVPETGALAVAIVAVASYALSYALTNDSRRRTVLVITAIPLGLLGWLLSVDSEALPILFSEAALFASSVIICAESRRLRGGIATFLVGMAGMMSAFQLVIAELNPDTHVLVYTHLWAAYAALAWDMLRRAGKSDPARFMLYAALIVFSLPSALVALSEGGAYSLLLLAEHAALVVVGVAFKQSLLVKWGVAVAILSMLYMLREFTYVNVGLIAALLIGYAVYRLNKTSKTG